MAARGELAQLKGTAAAAASSAGGGGEAAVEVRPGQVRDTYISCSGSAADARRSQ
jgi:hypothetical protein